MQDPTRDAPSVGTVEDSGIKVNFTRTDPFGFIHLFLDKGELPDRYKGQYTSADAAETDARIYIEEVKRQKKDKKAA